MKKILVLCLAMLFSSGSLAIVKDDFAYGYHLEVDGDGAIYSLILPEMFYRGVTRADRGDVRIFNSSGSVVPHVIRRMETPVITKLDDVELPIFPLYTRTDKNLEQGLENIRITTDDKGAVIDINYGKTQAKSNRLIGYFLDTSALKDAPASLSFAWKSGQADFVQTVNVQGSDDLTHWRTLGNSNTLTQMHYANHELLQDKIDLPLNKFKYLRIIAPKDLAFTLEKVVAHFPESTLAQPRQWTEVTSPEITRADGQIMYLFDSHSLLPVDRVDMRFQLNNSIARMTIESSSDKAGPWNVHTQSTMYGLKMQDITVHSPSATITMTAQRYWRIRMADQEVSIGDKPVLRLGWIPDQLLFLAQGEAPFTLAYGSAVTKPLESGLAVFPGIDPDSPDSKLIKVAQLGSHVVLGDVARLLPPPPPTPWKKYILWAILIIGVGLLGIMAIRLMKQMNQSPPTAS